MYQGSNLSRTAQLALNNNDSDQINNQLKLLKQKMSSRDTWQPKPVGNDLDALDSYKQQPFTQPLPQKQFQSQSPLYPRNEFEQYSKPPAYQTKQEAFKSQPQLAQQQDPRQMNFHQMQQYKAQYVMNNNAARSQEPIGTKILDYQPNNYQTQQKSNTYNGNQNMYNNGQYNGNNNYPNNNYNTNLNSYNNNNYNYNYNNNQNYQNNQQNNYYSNSKYQDNTNYNYNKIQDSYLNKQNQQLIYQSKQPSQLFSNNTQSTNYSNNNYSGDPYLKNTYKDDQQKKYQLYQQQANSVIQQQVNYKQQQQPIFPSEVNNSNYNAYNSLKHINQNNINLNQKQPIQSQQQQQLQPPSQQQRFYEKLQQDETLLKRQQQLQQPFKNEEPLPQRKNNNHQQQQYQQQYQQSNAPYQNAIDEMPAFVSKTKQPQIPQEEDDGASLIECPEGCGRSFKEVALEKHVKVCQKVFQSKRKEFNSKEARQVTNEQAKLEKQGLVKDKIIQQKKKAKGDPKWKKQSEQFRQMIAAARNGDVVAEQVNDDYVDCPGCGRKFNQNAADKHIPGCRKRNKK